jgi:hypothetical protein
VTSRWQCGVEGCGADGFEDTDTDARIAGGRHVASEHPEIYEAVTGHEPTAERLDGQELIERARERYSAS